MKSSKQPPSESSIKQALLGLYGIVGVTVSTFGPFKVPFAESHAKEYWRHALAGVVIVLILIAGIISLALYMFDANYFKSQMVEYVKTHNQRDLTLEGDIKVTFFPKLGLDSGKMTLSQRNSGKGFASIENARLYVAWWPLLRKQLQIESVALDGVHANLIRYKNGSTNIDDLLTTDASLGDIKFEIDSIRLNNSSANLQDETAGIFLSLHNVNIETGKLSDSTPGTVAANFRLESAKPHIDTKVKLNSHVLFELKTNHYEFANLEAEMEGEFGALSNLAVNFQGTINSYPALQRLVIDKFSTSAKGKLENRRLVAKLDIPKLQLEKNKLTGNSLSLTSSLLQEEENLTTTLQLPAFEMTDKKLQSENITANIDWFKAGRTLQGKINSPLSIDFESLLIQLPAVVSSFSGSHPALSSKLTANISGNMQANLSDQNIKFGLKAKIDDSSIVGSFGMQDFSHPAYTFDIGANTIDLDRYLATDWSKRLQDDALPFDFSALKELNLRGKLRSNDFKFAKLKVSNLVAEIKGEQSTLLIEPLGAHLYGGTTSASFSISANETPHISLKQKLTGVQLNALLSDIFPGEARLAGKANLSLDLSATGGNMGALRKALSGNASLALTRGSLAGIDLTEALLAGKTRLGMADGELSEAAKFTASTPFSELKSSFDIKEGKASNSDFRMKSPLFSSKGEGDITLESCQINYRLNTTVSPNLKRSSNGELAELKGISIPMRASGSYAAPMFILDFGAASGGNLAKLLKAKMPVAANPARPNPKPARK
ncbi:MAG TPA: AsmA family protein [Gallionellaceae bacterium]|nr:AsmA family protein [Gallionellaceae bacterium]